MKKLIFFLLLVCSFSIYGQRNFRDGYIIKQVGDTTFGQVAYRTNKTSALITHFRSEDNQTIQPLNPYDIIGFGYIGDKSMESKTLGFVGNQAYRVFVEIIFKGKINLYRYKNDYIFDKDEVLYLVTNRELVELNPGEKTLVYSDDDVRTIADLVSECHRTVIDQSGFKIVDKHLIQILKVYHQCMGEDYTVFKENKNWTQFAFSGFFGFNESKVKFESPGQSNDYLTKGIRKKSRSTFFGFQTAISFPRVVDSYSLITGFQIMESNYYRYYQRTLTTGIERHDVIINLNRLIFPLGLQYEFGNKRLPIYLTGGFNFSAHSRITIEHISESIDEETVTISYSEEPFTPKSGQIGVWAGVGIYLQVLERKRLFLELKYENTNGLVKRVNGKNLALGSSISNLKLLLGITL